MTTYNQFDVKANEKERAFFRKLGGEGYSFQTVKARKTNIIQKVTDKYVYVTTEKSKQPNRIKRSNLRRVLAMLFYRRVTTLKALIKIESFSSAVGALVRMIMFDICKVTTTKTGAVRLSLQGTRYFFSGVSKGLEDINIVKRNGGNVILINYFHVRNDVNAKWKKKISELGYDYPCVLLDPGEKSLYEAKLKGKTLEPIDIYAYGEFVRLHSDVIYQYLTLDVIGDHETTMRNTYALEEITGRKPIPVFHLQSSIDKLQEIVDADYEVIAIGGGCFVKPKQKREAKFTEIFNRFGDKNFHALGLGAMDTLLRFKWFSADASSWINARAFGTLLTLGKSMRRPKGMSDEEALGFNVRTFAALEDRYSDIQIDLESFPSVARRDRDLVM